MSKKNYRAELSDSIIDGSDVWVVDTEDGSFCEMTCPKDDAEAGANLIADALNAYSSTRSVEEVEGATQAVSTDPVAGISTAELVRTIANVSDELRTWVESLQQRVAAVNAFSADRERAIAELVEAAEAVNESADAYASQMDLGFCGNEAHNAATCACELSRLRAALTDVKGS